MSRWKALPAELDPRVRQLLVRLRRLKDHSGLSMRQLASKTAYSPKSWERYLSGRSLPPRDAVEAMARIGGDDPTRLLALHEVAAEAWRAGRAGTSAPEPAVTEPAEAESSVPAASAPESEVLSAGTEEARLPGRALRVALVSGSVALVLAVSSTVLVVVRIMDDRDGGAPAASHAASTASASPTVAKRVYRCRLERTGGRWYAGNSRALDATVAYGNSGPQVAEVQCLLRRRGISPGAIDGMFGPLTMGAVERFQKRARLRVDGIVGPHTWKVLRG
ncbi:peptidoglycan-binding protein [Streptomyces sp. NBC_00289]|uniref:peptidoglycan-binding protein n=1 Tax=Streptomyces sp. NBC_00289 TaxID=2975703 RepID=UPI0032432C44